MLFDSIFLLRLVFTAFSVAPMPDYIDVVDGLLAVLDYPLPSLVFAAVNTTFVPVNI